MKAGPMKMPSSRGEGRGASHRTGRPSTYSEDIAAEICARIAEGASLRTVCADEGMPGASTVFSWLKAHPDFKERYDTASVERASAIAEEALEIADKLSAGNGCPTSEEVQAARLQVDTRKWFAAKLAPKQYGDRMQTESVVTHRSPYANMTEEQIIAELATLGFVLAPDAVEQPRRARDGVARR